MHAFKLYGSRVERQNLHGITPVDSPEQPERGPGVWFDWGIMTKHGEAESMINYI